MKDDLYFLETKKCAKCGKEFYPAPQHVYREASYGKWYCSWTCYNHRKDKKVKENENEKEVSEKHESTRADNS